VPLSFFHDKNAPPSDDALRSALAGAGGLWQELIEQIAMDIAPVAFVWGFTSKSTGWSLRVKRGERNILYMTPREGYFLVSIGLGERAAASARKSELRDAIAPLIDAAPKYAEGRGIRFEVHGGEMEKVAIAVSLASAKIWPHSNGL
jgi:hypothetical protein